MCGDNMICFNDGISILSDAVMCYAYASADNCSDFLGENIGLKLQMDYFN